MIFTKEKLTKWVKAKIMLTLAMLKNRSGFRSEYDSEGDRELNAVWL